MPHIALPTFTSASSPELYEKLNRHREELFIPFFLSIQQRKLMAKKRHAQRLEEEPVTVTIGQDNEQFTLRHMDPQKRPKSSEIPQIISLMKTKEDWDNLIPFLAGLRLSRRELKPQRWQWLIRKAGEADRLGLILECAKQAKRTGLHLKDIDIVQTVFFQLHSAAKRAQFRNPVLSKVLGFAKQFVELMETPEHVVHDGQLDPKRRPFVIGVLLELSAARVMNEQDGNDKMGEALSYAHRLCATWELGDYTTSTENWVFADRLLRENIPVANALQLATQMTGIHAQRPFYSVLKSNLEQVKKQIGALEQAAPERVQQKPTLGYSDLHLISS